MTADQVPARPLRQWLIAWTITTQDPPEVTACGFDLEDAFVIDLLGPEPPRMLNIAVARDACRKLRADPAELWRPELAQGGRPMRVAG